MSKKHRKEGQSAKVHDDGPPRRLADDELAALDEFCSFELEEVAFEAWCETHVSLDLYVTLILTKQEAGVGGTKEVIFTRSTTTEASAKSEAVPGKAKVCQLVAFESGVRSGATLRIAGAGDHLGDRVGDLIVIIQVT